MVSIKGIIKKLYYKLNKQKPIPFFMLENPKYERYRIGEFTYGHPRVVRVDDKTNLIIGKYCSIAAEVTILLGGEHRTDWVTTYPFNVLFPEANKYSGHPASKGDIVIGNDVWIGREVLILSGVCLGNGAVIAAGSVVTKSVDPYTIVGGNPAKTIRKRFSDAEIQALEKIAWWNWDRERIVEALPLLLNSDIQAFISTYSERSDK